MRFLKTRAKRSGAAAAELAILLPFVGLMFVVALDFCRIFYVTQTLENCAWTGAMYASGNASPVNGTSPTTAGQQAAVAEGGTLDPPLQASNVTVTINPGSVQVTVQYPFQMLTAFMGNAGNVTLTRTVKMAAAPQPFSP